MLTNSVNCVRRERSYTTPRDNVLKKWAELTHTHGFKQRNARTNPETSDTGQTHLSTLEPINVRQTVDVSERAHVNYDNISAPGDSDIDATDGESGETPDSEADRLRTDRSSKRKRNTNNVCIPNTESDCDDNDML